MRLSIIRDFVDVRDVVRAYYDLLLHGRPGELYNVCSGVGNRLSDIVDKIARILEIDIDTVVNPEYIRLNDNHIIVGSCEKINRDIGWKPLIPIDRTIEDMIEYCRSL